MSAVFYYPFGAPTLILILRNPELGDGDIKIPKVKTKIAMDGAFYSHISTNALTRFTLTFQSLTRRKVLEVENFMENAIGDWIRYIDKNSVNWKAKLLDDPIEFSTSGRGPGIAEPKETNEVTFSLEGTQL